MKPKFKVEQFINGKARVWKYVHYQELINDLRESKRLAPESFDNLHVTEFFYSELYNGNVMHATSLMANQVLDRVADGNKR